MRVLSEKNTIIHIYISDFRKEKENIEDKMMIKGQMKNKTKQHYIHINTTNGDICLTSMLMYLVG